MDATIFNFLTEIDQKIDQAWSILEQTKVFKKAYYRRCLFKTQVKRNKLCRLVKSFQFFCKNLRMSDVVLRNVRARTKNITRRINSDIRCLNSDTRYSMFVGSYGRGTAIHTSDIDLVIELPYLLYTKYNSYSGNGQSALLQEVRNTIHKTYSTTHISGDGQVVKLNFTDGVCFEIVPVFINKDASSFTYPDTNNGGSWKITKPREEIAEINKKNNEFNSNLKHLSRMARAWKEKWNVPINGLLIDTLAYNFLLTWEYSDNGFIFYDWMTRDFFCFFTKAKFQSKLLACPRE